MHFLNHRQKSRGHVLPMPEGLQELMADISREVLRYQPSIDCTYKFIADYLEAMVNTRDKSKIAMEVIEDAILKTDEVYSEFVKCNIPKEKTNRFLNVMEITFRRFVEKKRQGNQDPRFIKFQADDMLDEFMRKCDLTKVEVLRSRPAIQWAYRKFVKTYLAAIEGTLDTEDLYFNTEKVVASCKEFDHMHQCAIQIQKVFRGYQTRKSLQGSQHLQSIKSSEDSSSTSSFRNFILGREEELNKAAIKIQASYKGFYVRKKTALELKNCFTNEDVKKKVSLRPYPVSESDKTYSANNKSSYDNSEALENSLKEVGTIAESIVEAITGDMEIFQSQDIVKEIEETVGGINIEHEKAKSSNNDSDNLNEAAVKIQATFKGYKVRKEISHKPKMENTNTSDKQHSDSE